MQMLSWTRQGFVVIEFDSSVRNRTISFFVQQHMLLKSTIVLIDKPCVIKQCLVGNHVLITNVFAPTTRLDEEQVMFVVQQQVVIKKS